MKKLFYAGLTALMMLFAFGTAKAENAKVKVVLAPTSWEIATDAPQFTVTITQATAEEGEEAAPDLALGTAEGNVAVKVTLTNGEKTVTQTITRSSVALTTTNITVDGTWTLSYSLVKGNAQTVEMEDVDLDEESTPTLTVTPATLPADDENAPVLTFTPDDTETVDNNTEIFVTGDITGYTMEYGTYATIAAAKKAYYGYTYGVDYPKVTEDEPVLKIFLTNQTTYEEYAYYRVYDVREASDVEMPMITSENGMCIEMGLYPKGDQIKILADGADAVWYTTDGSKPTIDGATSTKIEGDEDGVAGVYILNSSVTIKAIAVKDGKASDVQTAHYMLFADAHAALMLYNSSMSPVSSDDVVGKNAPIMAVMTCEESESLTYMYPYTVYYTTDGETEPTKEAYTEGGKIMKSETPMGDWGPEGNPSVLVSENGATLKAKAYLHIADDGLDEWIASETLTVTFTNVKAGLENPVFSRPAGDVCVGDTIRIKNPNTTEEPDEDDEESETEPVRIYFSINGPLPTSDLITLYPTVVYRTEAEEDVVIVVKEDENGTYAYVPGNEKYYDGSEIIRFEGKLKVQAICYGLEENGTNPMTGRPAFLEYGSDFVEMNYSNQVATPTFSVKAGNVVAGTEVELTTTTADAKIYYTLDGEDPSAESTEYEEAIVIDEDVTIKAIAIKEGMKASQVATAAYEVAEIVIEPIEFTFDPEAGSEVEENTQITITTSRDLEEDEVIVFAMFATREDAEACTTEEMVVEGKGTIYGEPVEGDDEVGYPIITAAAPVLKVGYMSDIDEEGNLIFDWTYAEYTVKVVSNQEAELAGVAVYPNPSDGLFNVSVPVQAQVEVFTATGMMVNNFTVAEGATQLRLKNTGIYFVRFTAENGQVAVKRVIVR